MKIKTVTIKNFKCLGDQELTIDLSDDIVVLIGENNVGKSSFLEALRYFFSGKIIPKDLFYEGKTGEENAIELTVEFNSLTTADKEHQAIKPYFISDGGEEVWVLKKKYYYSNDGKGECKYWAKKVDGKWIKDPAGLKQVSDDLFTNEKMQVPFIGAVKDVEEETSSGAKAAFGQIFNILIKADVEKQKEYVTLQAAIEDYTKLFEGEKKLSSISSLEKSIDQKMQRVINGVSKIQLDTPSFKDKILPNPVLLTNDQREIDVKPGFQGNGYQRALIFSLLELLAEQASPKTKEIGPRNLILIEEPEMYMHPQMERKIADALYEIARDGSAQIVCTTHSPIFINVADKHKALVRLNRGHDNKVVLSQVSKEIFSGATKEENKARLRMILNFDPTVNEVFFAKRVVLVEGDTEVAVFKESAELLGIFHDEKNRHLKRDVTFVNCRGKWTIVAFQEVLNHFKIDYVVIHDKDDSDEKTGANAKILELLQGDENRRKLCDKYIEEELGIKEGKSKPFNALQRIQELADAHKLESQFGAIVNFAYGLT